MNFQKTDTHTYFTTIILTLLFTFAAKAATTPSGNVTPFPIPNRLSDLYIGDTTHGELLINNGGYISNGNGYIGHQQGSTGIATVSDSSFFSTSVWENNIDLYVGNQGHGTLNIESGGYTTSNSTYVGAEINSTGIVNITDPESTLYNAYSLNVGHNGNGTLNIENGASIIPNQTSIGSTQHGIGTVNVIGPDSTWLNAFNTNASDVYVGNHGQGTLNIRDGATVNNTDTYIGTELGSTGTVNVVGQNSTMFNSEDLYIGYGGNGTLNIENNAHAQVRFHTHINGNSQLHINHATFETENLTHHGNISISLDDAFEVGNNPTLKPYITIEEHVNFFNGTFTIDLSNGFIPQPGQSFTILTYQTRFRGSSNVLTINAPLGLDFKMKFNDFLGTATLTTNASLEGDTNLDGVVNLADLGRLATNFGNSQANGDIVQWQFGDFTLDGVINLADLAILATNFGRSINASSPILSAPINTIPEPTSLFILLSTFTLFRKRK